jgi:hypothetical protein
MMLCSLLLTGRLWAGAEASIPLRPAPRLTPDYVGLVIPPNIAPLNFKVENPGTRYRVEWHSTRGEPIVVDSRSPLIQTPIKQWRSLLRTNVGETLLCEVSVRDTQGQWRQFQTITNHIAREEIDPCLTYRLLKPLYSVYVNLGLYQRDLTSFEQRPILENEHIHQDCLNCHTPLNRSPDTFAFHTRTTGKVHPMILVRSNEAVRVDKTMGYISWHPSGRLLAYSGNKLSLFYHTKGETRDVFDAQSDLGIYRVDSNTFANPPAIAAPDRNETWPEWSPDGRYLYFCSAAPMPADDVRQIKYDLLRVSYDLERDQWGKPEVLLASPVSGLSAGQPKVAPNGRYLLFTLCRYGNFPIYKPSSDLYVMDLETRQIRRPDINSEQAESWHSWSSNSHWVVFSSKRLDGLFARPFFSYVDDQGEFHKPFLLPQENPEFYDSFLKTINLPQLVGGPITIPESELARTVLNPAKSLTPQSSSLQAAPALASPSGTDMERSRFQPTAQ